MSYHFLPGLLGALTLYILSRASYFQLVFNRKWSKGWAAGLFMIYYLFLIGLPVFLAITLISPKINTFLGDPNAMINAVRDSINTIQQKIGFKIISENTVTNSLSKLTAFIPSILNSTANSSATWLLCFYPVLYAL